MIKLLIDGTVYDVTDFIKKHPGGSVIKYYANSDATAAFNEFHYRSKSAKKILQSLPIVAEKNDTMNYPKNKELLTDFYILKQKLVNMGYFKPSISHVTYRGLEIALLFFVATLGFHLKLFNIVIACFIFGIAEGRCGWFMHEAGHYSLTGNIVIDRKIQNIFYGLGCGMSSTYWRNQHNKHHATPQKLKHDVDLNTLPLVAFHSSIAQKVKNPILKTWIHYQSYYFSPVITTLVVLFWQFYLHPRFCLRTRNSTEIKFLMARLVGWTTLCMLNGWSVKKSILIYLLKTIISANYIFVNFAVSHTHRDIVQENEYQDWVHYSANHTTNCNPSILCNWWMSYLNFQIEHHLFPSLPQFRTPLVAPYVKSLFKKHGLVYDSRSYITCLSDTFTNLSNVGKQQTNKIS